MDKLLLPNETPEKRLEYLNSTADQVIEQTYYTRSRVIIPAPKIITMNNNFHFAKFIGNDVLITKSNLIGKLTSIRNNYATVKVNNTEQPIMFEGIKVIIDSRIDLIRYRIPPEIAIMAQTNVAVTSVEINKFQYLDELQHVVYDIYKTTHEEIMAVIDKRKREFVIIRQLIMAVYHKTLPNLVSLSEAGRLYGKDHATVLHAIKTINNLYETNSNIRELWQPIRDLALSINPNIELSLQHD